MSACVYMLWMRALRSGENLLEARLLGDPAHLGYEWFGCLSYIGHHQEARVVPGKTSASTTVALVVLPRKVSD